MFSHRVDYREGEDGTLNSSKSNSHILLPDKLLGDEIVSLFALTIPEYSVPMFISKSDDQKRFILQRYILVRSDLGQEHVDVLQKYCREVAWLIAQGRITGPDG